MFISVVYFKLIGTITEKLPFLILLCLSQIQLNLNQNLFVYYLHHFYQYTGHRRLLPILFGRKRCCNVPKFKKRKLCSYHTHILRTYCCRPRGSVFPQEKEKKPFCLLVVQQSVRSDVFPSSLGLRTFRKPATCVLESCFTYWRKNEFSTATRIAVFWYGTA